MSGGTEVLSIGGQWVGVSKATHCKHFKGIFILIVSLSVETRHLSGVTCGAFSYEWDLCHWSGRPHSIFLMCKLSSKPVLCLFPGIQRLMPLRRWVLGQVGEYGRQDGSRSWQSGWCECFFFVCVCVCMCVVVPLSHDVLLLLCVSVEQASTVCGLDCAKAQEWCTGNQFQLL